MASRPEHGRADREYPAILSRVAVSWPGRPVLGPFDLRVGPGEIVAVIGASGAGKSTVLRLLAGLERPSSGAVLRAPEGSTGFVFQSAALFCLMIMGLALNVLVGAMERAARRRLA